MRKKSLPVSPEGPSRREFLSDATVATGLGILSVCGLGCQSTWTNHDVVVSVESKAQVLQIDLERYPQLKTCGGFLPMADMANGLRLIVFHSLEGEYLAFNMSCTHKGADVELNKDKTGLVCPLHKSHFSLTGERVSGPARRDLEVFPVSKNGSLLRVHLEDSAV